MNNPSNNQNDLVERALKALNKEYVLVGKTRVRGWHAWLAIGVAAGFLSGVILVANRSGEFYVSSAQTSSQIWGTSSQCGWVTKSPVEVELVRVLMQETDTSVKLWPPGQWNTVNTNIFGVPTNAKIVFLQGLLHISHGTVAAQEDSMVWFRAPGESANPAKLDNGQVWKIVSNLEEDYERTPTMTIVPVRNGKFEFWWHTTAQGTWPEKSTSSLRIRLLGWCM